MEGNVTVYRMLENFIKYWIKITKFGIIVLEVGLLKYYSIGEFAKAIGKTTKTLRNWDKNGKLKPVRVEDTGYKYYSQEQLDRFLFK